jgi:UrcA family protein
MTTSTLKTLIFTTLLVLATGNALADSAAKKTLAPAPVSVRYDDLNLANAEGAHVLYNRISEAARKVCGPSFATFYPGKWREWKECYQSTVDAAVKRVDAPMLTALHAKSISVAAR